MIRWYRNKLIRPHIGEANIDYLLMNLAAFDLSQPPEYRNNGDSNIQDRRISVFLLKGDTARLDILI